MWFERAATIDSSISEDKERKKKKKKKNNS